MTPRKEEIMTYKILEKIRGFNGYGTKKMLIEEKDNDKSIAITDDPKFGDNALTHQIEQFRMSVDSGAQFAKPTEQVSDCPLIYMPKTGNLVFTGTIPRLNNLIFQFVLRTNTGNGCFIWADKLILSEENLKTIEKIHGYYLNWKEAWESEYRDLEMLKNMEDL